MCGGKRNKGKWVDVKSFLERLGIEQMSKVDRPKTEI